MSGSSQKPVSGAGASGSKGSGVISIPSIEEKNKKIQQETLMEKIRAKYRAKPKSYEDIKKSVRMYFIEKHYPMDPVHKATLQTALDKLQNYIKVTSRHGLVERLESLSRQLGLKFMEDQQTLFISTDMFYVEILLDTSGNLNDVKVHHECKIEQQASTSSSSSSSSPELLNCLKAGDFADFTVQLEGLSSIYQLNAEPKVKKKAFVALQAMETDIYNLYQHQLQLQQRTNGSSNSYQIMNNSSVGLVLPRRGGHPMKLTYFCPPLHIVETSVKGEQGVGASSGTESRDFNIDQVIKSPQGSSATLNLEGSSANKLQILPIVSFTSEDGSPLEMPTYLPLTQNNSMLMPATYVLRLSKPMPVCIESLRALGLPGLPAIEPGEAGTRTVMNLIIETASRQAIRNTQKGLYVNLIKETHCYFMTDNRRLQGTLISSLPFTEPAQVPKIIAFLKKQALFCTLLSSCVREQQKHYNDMDSTVILEVTAVSLNQITVELQHPYEESLATVDFLLDGDGDGQPSCIIYCLNYDYEALSQKLTRTVRQVFSIPMVIYKLLRCWDEEHQQKMHGVMPSPSSGSSGGHTGGFGSSRGAGAGGGGSSAVGGTHGSSNFGQFALDAGTGGATSGVGFTSVSDMKMENKLRTLADGFAASTSAAAAIAGLMNLKRETDPQASSSSSPPVVPTSSSPASSSKDQEIADKYKNIWKDKTPNLKHSVSITPIAGDGKSPLQQQQGQVDVQRTGGIEIIPLNVPTTVTSGATAGAGSPATTITITPITGSGKEAGKESKKSTSSGSGSKRPHDTSALSSSSSSNSSNSSSGSNSSNETQKEKKRKKKRDDSPMGPPEKIYSRQNSPGMTADGASGSGVVRKFSTPAASSSPKAGGSAAGASLGLGLAGQSSARPSPKHSPVYSSPKHSSNSNTASNSPKSPFGTHSPKHGSSGKPSMSTLKSATAATGLSLSPKAEKSSAGSSGSGALPLPLGGLPMGLTSTGSGSGSVSGSNSGSNPPMLRPVPPLASSSQLPLSIKKDKSSSSSNVTATSSHPSGVVTAAVAALKISQQQQQQQQQQQMKSTVASLSHLAAGGSLGNYAAPAVSALELNAMRKGLTGTGSGVGPGMGVGAAAGAVGAVSLMMSTPASTTTASAAATTTVPASGGSSTTAVTTSAVETGVGTTTQPQQQAMAPLSIYSSVSSSSSSSSGIGGTSNVAGSSAPSSSPSTEYMVKTSQEGLKLTINKTGNSSSKRESKGGPTGSSASSSSSSSKKQHTGLKPGVNSGPACKKAGSGGSSGSSKHLFQKANSSGNLSSKLSGSSGSGLTLTKSNSTNTFQEQQGVPKRRPSLTNTGGQRKTTSTSHASGSGTGGSTGRMSPAALSGSMSQPTPRFDHHTDMMTILQYASPSMAANMEGFIKGLHNKFQIPKLSQRPSGSSGSGGRTTPNPDQQTTIATTTSSLSQEQEQVHTDPGALTPTLSVAPSGSSASQRSTSGAVPTPNEMLLTQNTGEGSSGGDGVDEDLLASLAGE